MKRICLTIVIGCAICAGIAVTSTRDAQAGDGLDCARLEKWSSGHGIYSNGSLVYFKQETRMGNGHEWKCDDNGNFCSSKSKPGDGQWKDQGECKSGTEPH